MPRQLFKKIDRPSEDLNNYWFSDDVSLLSKNIQDLQIITNGINDGNEKAKVMTVSRDGNDKMARDREVLQKQ